MSPSTGNDIYLAHGAPVRFDQALAERLFGIRVMKITVDLKMKRLITVAEITGSLDASVIAEPATRALVKKIFVDSFKRSGLSGTVLFDDERVEL